MRGSLRWIAALAVVMVVAIAVFAATAEAHTGTVAISCDQVTFTFASFPTGPNAINWVVDGQSGTGSIGSSGTVVVPLNFASGDHHVTASASWTVDGGGSTSGEADLSCGSPPPPPPPPPSTTTVTTPAPPPPTVTVTTTTPAPPPVTVTVTTTTPAPPPITVTKTKTRTVVKWRTKVVYRTHVKWRRATCHCPPGSKLILVTVNGHRRYVCGVPGSG